MTDRELMQMALDALEEAKENVMDWGSYASEYFKTKHGLAQDILAIENISEALRARLAQPEPEIEPDRPHVEGDGCPTEKAVLQRFWREHQKQEPVAWLITDEKINSLQVDSIQYLIDRARHAHMTDIKLRINGQDEWYQADWLKHLTRTAPPQREWQTLTENEIKHLWYEACQTNLELTSQLIVHLARNIEAKLKEKNSG